VNVKKLLMHHTPTLKRTEPSPFLDQFKYWKTFLSQKTDRLQRTHTEEPKRALSAKETMLKVVLVAETNVSKLLFAPTLLLVQATEN
jgi:hypothetical protein